MARLRVAFVGEDLGAPDHWGYRMNLAYYWYEAAH